MQKQYDIKYLGRMEGNNNVIASAGSGRILRLDDCDVSWFKEIPLNKKKIPLKSIQLLKEITNLDLTHYRDYSRKIDDTFNISLKNKELLIDIQYYLERLANPGIIEQHLSTLSKAVDWSIEADYSISYIYYDTMGIKRRAILSLSNLCKEYASIYGSARNLQEEVSK
jgi:hypothetical protein